MTSPGVRLVPWVEVLSQMLLLLPLKKKRMMMMKRRCCTMDVEETGMMIPMTLAEAVEAGIAVAAMVVGIGRMILGRTIVVHTAREIRGVLALDLVRLGTRDVLLGLVRG